MANTRKYYWKSEEEKQIFDKLIDLYSKTTKFDFNKLNIPRNIYQQREQIFRNFREETIKYINFGYDEMEGTVYDFKINNYKIQEKISKKYDKENRYLFFLCKNNGKLKEKNNKIQYDIGDNDFYWLNCENKKIFFVIPEKILIEKGYIGNKEENKNKQFLKFPIKNDFYIKSKWVQPYIFNYETINEEENKNRLLDLLNLKSQ